MTDANIVLSRKTHKCKTCGEKKPLDTFRRVFISEKDQYKDMCIDCKTNIFYEQIYNKAEYEGIKNNINEKTMFKKIITNLHSYLGDTGEYKNKERWI